MVHFATLLTGLLSSLMLLTSIGGLLLLAANLVAQRRRVDRSLRPIRVLARRSRDREPAVDEPLLRACPLTRAPPLAPPQLLRPLDESDRPRD